MATDKTSASKVQILFLHFEIGFQSKVAKIKKLRSLQMFLVFCSSNISSNLNLHFRRLF